MRETTLVIMAAGMGSRYGGLKQIDPVDEYGNILMDFSIYDAKMAGFEKVVFVIKREDEENFEKTIGKRICRNIRTAVMYQDLENIPDGFHVPESRVKPWGTGHAILSCESEIDGPFAVINSDDFYGREAFRMIFDYLNGTEDRGRYEFAMAGYRLENTLTENGCVARGICDTDGEGYLTAITERTKVGYRGKDIVYIGDDGAWVSIPGDTPVSMNFWGFPHSIFGELKIRFRAFLERCLAEDPTGGEFYIPTVVGDMLSEGIAKVKVLNSHDKWFGVTYREDKASVVEEIKKIKAQGLYPDRLWD